MTQFVVRVGDHVAFSAAFLRSIGQQTGPLGQARGVVREVTRLAETSLATVKWDSDEIPQRVNVANLARIGANRRFCACD